MSEGVNEFQQPVENPSAFISYSWSSREHEEWVLQLATELVENGVDVVIDKWNLKRGHDKYAFMEKMVNDQNIRKVVIVCDRLYAEKADGREGGVGTETQIISPELYEKVDQEKFVAVITEVDDNGEPYLPTFLKNRIYIDMSAPDLRSKNFEELLRWIFDKPLYRKPKLGKPPISLFQDKKSLGTTSRYRQAIEALQQGKSIAPGSCQDYFDTFAENLEGFRINREEGREFDDQVIESIKEFQPYRDEIINLFMAIAKYRYDSEMNDIVHRFFENILPYICLSNRINDDDSDNFKFIFNELFIYAVASFLKMERFDFVNELLSRKYYLKSNLYDAPENRMVPYTWFNFYPNSLERRNQRINKPKRLDLKADMHKERAVRRDLSFDDFMQAEFIIYVRRILQSAGQGGDRTRWFPHSLLYTSIRGISASPFEIFARAESTSYFHKIKALLCVRSKEELISRMDEYLTKNEIPQWQFDRIDVVNLMNINKLATAP